jgi:hypothetical protein
MILCYIFILFDLAGIMIMQSVMKECEYSGIICGSTRQILPERCRLQRIFTSVPLKKWAHPLSFIGKTGRRAYLRPNRARYEKFW